MKLLKMHLAKPTFLIDKGKSIVKIEKMLKKSQRQGLIFRPHFKTHQSKEVGGWFREVGVQAITVSSFEMAEFFASDGWSDITVAFSVNPNEVETIKCLSGKVNLNVVLEDISVVDQLDSKLDSPIGVYIEINTGYHRAGLNPRDIDLITPLIQRLDKSHNFDFRGFLTFAGHSYHARSEKEILRVHSEYMEDMLGLKKEYISSNPMLELSIGDTPTCSIAEDFNGIGEMRPGNFIFYDLMQVIIGSCTRDQVSAIVACPVVAIHKDRGEIIIFGGAVHFSKEAINTKERGDYHGDVVMLQDGAWSCEETGAYLSWVTQEHGIVKAPESFINRIKIGDFIGVIPVHSCLTANLMKKSTLILNSENEAIEE
ncbi:MAG: alanine racemase [Cyclobacteriaceae bacterium]